MSINIIRANVINLTEFGDKLTKFALKRTLRLPNEPSNLSEITISH